MTRIATLCAIVASVSVSAQTPPAASDPVTVTGCVAQAQRDGSLGAKATGTEATPATAATEANNPNPTGRYQLVDATGLEGSPQQAESRASAKPAAALKTSYALRGQEQELAKHVGHRVQVVGTLAPALADKLPAKTAATAEGTRTVQVSSVKMIDTNCSVAEGQ